MDLTMINVWHSSIGSMYDLTIGLYSNPIKAFKVIRSFPNTANDTI